MDLNNFGPFHFEVWGSFSDWIMILVTFGTLLYLVKTFRAQSESLKLQQKTLESQLVVQEDQQKITEIEQRRFKLEIQPDYNISYDEPNKKLTIIPNKFDLLQAKFRLDILHRSVVTFNGVFYEKDSYRFTKGFPLELNFDWDNSLPSDVKLFSITGSYQDGIGTKYEKITLIVTCESPINHGPVESIK